MPIDWRAPERRLEVFSLSYHWRRLTGDLDQTHVTKVACDHLRLDDDARAWFSLLYGHAYRSGMALIYLQLFPDPLQVKVSQVQSWTDANWKRLLYNKDQRWQIGKLPRIVEGIQKWARGARLGERFRELVGSPSRSKNFYRLLKSVRTIPYYGRMTAWLTLQAAYDSMGLNINHPDLLMEEDSCWSPYNGLCYLFGRDYLCRSKTKVPGRYEFSLMKRHLDELVSHLNDALPYRETDIFRLESHLCDFRKWASSPPHEYLGLTSAEVNMLYPEYKRRFPEVDLFPFLKGLMTLHPSIRGLREEKRLLTAYPTDGRVTNLNDLLPGEPDLFAGRGIPKSSLRMRELYEDYPHDVAQDASDHAPVRYEEFKPGERDTWFRWAGLKEYNDG